MAAAIHPTVRAALVAALKAEPGLNGAALAREHGVSAETVSDLRRQHGVPSKAGRRYAAIPQPNDDAIRAMWAEGLSATEMGRRLKRTKDSIIGRVHRLGLARRPSPIGVSTALPPGEKARRESAERKAGYQAGSPWHPWRSHACRRVRSQPAPPPAPAAPPPALVIAPAATGRVRPCCWPVETVGRRHVMCDAASLPRQPYCAEHDALAHGRRAA